MQKSLALPLLRYLNAKEIQYTSDSCNFNPTTVYSKLKLLCSIQSIEPKRKL